MDDQVMGMMLREVARLHLQMQRTSIACCSGTTSTQCFILTELGRSGTITLAELTRRLGLDKGWTSRAVDSMAQADLIVKTPSETDRRAINLSLTPAGEIRYSELNEALNEHSGRVMRWIAEADHPVVYRALEVLRDALRAEAADDSSPASEGGICGTGVDVSCCQPC